MMFPSDRDDADVRDEIDPEYLLGRFDPRDAQRILKRLEEEHVPFRVEDCSEFGQTALVTDVAVCSAFTSAVSIKRKQKR